MLILKIGSLYSPGKKPLLYLIGMALTMPACIHIL